MAGRLFSAHLLSLLDYCDAIEEDRTLTGMLHADGCWA